MEGFKKHLSSAGYSQGSIKKWLYWLKTWELWRVGVGKKLEALTSKDLLGYLESKSNLTAVSLEIQLRNLRYYYSYQGLECPLLDFKIAVKNGIASYDYLSENDLRLLYQKSLDYSRMSVESQVLVGVLVYQGLSTKELPNLLVSSINIAEALLELSTRSIPLVALQLPLLLRYISDKSKDDHLFNYRDKKHLQNKHTGLKVQLQRSLSGVDLRFKNLYQLRASRIALWIEKEGILQAQYYAGHGHLRSTQAYDRTGLAQLREAFEGHHPMFVNEK